MAQLAIKGHGTRGKEVIEILEMLGGKQFKKYLGNNNCLYYTITDGKIEWYYPSDEYKVFTLEEFLEKFPYKIGDKVLINDIENDVYTIKSMVWDDEFNRVNYKIESADGIVDDYPWFAEEMEFFKNKKETMEKRKYADLRLDIDQDDKLAIEVTIGGDKITPPENYLIGKVTIVDNGMLVEFVKKQLQYPKTYEGCCMILQNACMTHKGGYKCNLIQAFQKLLICRDAYWKIAKDWEEKRKKKVMHYVIFSTLLGEIAKDTMPNCIANYLLDFPTEEMRDAFYENFKDLIEACKELL